jgi:hypothetical protein
MQRHARAAFSSAVGAIKFKEEAVDAIEALSGNGTLLSDFSKGFQTLRGVAELMKVTKVDLITNDTYVLIAYKLFNCRVANALNQAYFSLNPKHTYYDYACDPPPLWTRFPLWRRTQAGATQWVPAIRGVVTRGGVVTRSTRHHGIVEPFNETFERHRSIDELS